MKRAALTSAAQSEQELLDALNAAHAHGGLDEHVYDGAADLGGWAGQRDHLEVSLAAWQLASHASPSDSDAAILSRAHALIEVGISMFRFEAQERDENPPRQSILSDPNMYGGPLAHFVLGVSAAAHANPEVYRVLAEAAGLIRPLALRPSPDGALTRAQPLFARNIAFLRADASRLRPLHADTSSLPDVSAVLKLPLHAGANLCVVGPIAQPMPNYPNSSLRDSNVGAVGVRFVIDDSGTVSDARVVAAVGGEPFERAVSAVVGRWRVERAPASAAGCDMAMTLFVPVVFGFSN